MPRKPGAGPRRQGGPSGLGRPMTEDEAFTFLLGGWVDTPSSCVARVRYDEAESALEIAYKDARGQVVAECRYQGVSRSEAQSLAESSSKGVWKHENLVLAGKPFYYLSKSR